MRAIEKKAADETEKRGPVVVDSTVITRLLFLEGTVDGHDRRWFDGQGHRREGRRGSLSTAKCDGQTSGGHIGAF